MHHGQISKPIADGLLELRSRIEKGGIPSSKLDETLNLATWNIREFGKKARTEAAIQTNRSRLRWASWPASHSMPAWPQKLTNGTNLNACAATSQGRRYRRYEWAFFYDRLTQRREEISPNLFVPNRDIPMPRAHGCAGAAVFASLRQKLISAFLVPCARPCV